VHIFSKHRGYVAAIAVTTLVITACSSGNGSTSDTTTDPAPINLDIDLSKTCPSEVGIQTDWNPQAEHGFVYQMLGEDYDIDNSSLSVSGTLQSNGNDTGVKLRIYAGGPAIGFEPVISRLYSKPEILLTFMSTDIAIANSKDKPTVAVIAPFNVNPQIIMWDPETYPEVESIPDLKTSNVRVLYFRNVAYMRYLVGAGILNESQVEDSYDGFPEQFITANGTVAQQGFGTNEPYYYENQLDKWLKPVRYQYLHELGWTPYAQTLATTPERKAEFDSCLRLLVPIIQQSQVDYISDPARANTIIVETVSTFSSGTRYDIDQATASTAKQVSDGLVTNSPDGTLGSFDFDRLAKFLEIAVPIFKDRGDSVRDGLIATDIATNEYINPSIALR
jgi:hypothetical protein